MMKHCYDTCDPPPERQRCSCCRPHSTWRDRPSWTSIRGWPTCRRGTTRGCRRPKSSQNWWSTAALISTPALSDTIASSTTCADRTTRLSEHPRTADDEPVGHSACGLVALCHHPVTTLVAAVREITPAPSRNCVRL